VRLPKRVARTSGKRAEQVASGTALAAVKPGRCLVHRYLRGDITSTSGVSGEMIRDLMLESVERRFRGASTPHPVQWLSDNGSAYRAYDTIDFAVRLELVPCFTPVRSSQSNGMAEAFVKTFKRDYVYVYDRPDAQSVLSQLPGWFED
jgi:putative transposase